MHPALALAIVLLVVIGLYLPRVGFIARRRQARRLAARVRQEDALKSILKCEANGQAPSIDTVAGALQTSTGRATALLADMEERGLITYEGGGLSLRDAGREIALHIVRAHRLWESYLADQTGVSEKEWHHRADRQEHLLSRQQAEELAAQLGYPVRDPHGDQIPAADGELPADAGESLNAARVNTPLRITHIEDEPQAIYAQLVALGLRAGMELMVLEKAHHRVRFWANSQEHVLAPLLANNISVAPIPAGEASDLIGDQHLGELRPGQHARVLALSPACRGAERRRLLDLGFVPGSDVEIEMVSPGGDPTAYRIRGSVIALRHQQARLVRVAIQQSVAA